MARSCPLSWHRQPIPASEDGQAEEEIQAEQSDHSSHMDEEEHSEYVIEAVNQETPVVIVEETEAGLPNVEGPAPPKRPLVVDPESILAEQCEVEDPPVVPLDDSPSPLTTFLTLRVSLLTTNKIKNTRMRILMCLFLRHPPSCLIVLLILLTMPVIKLLLTPRPADPGLRLPIAEPRLSLWPLPYLNGRKIHVLVDESQQPFLKPGFLHGDPPSRLLLLRGDKVEFQPASRRPLMTLLSSSEQMDIATESRKRKDPPEVDS